MRTLHQATIRPTVSIVRILTSGEPVITLNEYREVADRFTWENRSEILQQLFNLQQRTDNDKRSYIVIYEATRSIREYLNVDEFFRPPLQ